jgi:hypothetical protein
VPGIEAGDSISYRLPPQGMSSDPLYQFDYMPQTIWGDSIRPFPTVFLNWISPNDSITVLLQGIISIFSWVCLLRTVQKIGEFYRSYWLSYLNSGIVFTLGLSQAVIQFDRIILSESISLSLFVILASIFLNPKFKQFGVINFIGFAIIFYLCLITRPNSILISIPFLIYSIYLLFKYRNRKTISLFLSLSVVTVIAILYNINQNKAWAELISRPMTSLSYYLSTDNPSHKLFIGNLNNQKSIPNCVQVYEPLEGGKQMEWGSRVNRECSEGKVWAQNHAYFFILSSYYKSFPEPQLLLVRNLISSSRIVVATSNYIPMPKSIVELLLPSDPIGPALPDRYESKQGRIPASFYDPLIMWSIVLCCLYIFNLRIKRNMVPKTIRNFLEINIKLVVLLSGLTIMWGISVLLIPGPDGELWRLALTPNLMIRTLIYIALNLQIFKTFKILRSDKI